MKMIRCAYCTRADVAKGTATLMRSERFPSVYLHGICRYHVWARFEAIGVKGMNTLIAELVLAEDEKGRQI